MKLYKPKRPSVNPQCSMFFVGDQGFVKYGDERYLECLERYCDDLEEYCDGLKEIIHELILNTRPDDELFLSVIDRVPLEDLEKPKMTNNPFFTKNIREISKK